MDITQLLAFSVKNKASDLHLSSGLPPMIRVHGDVRRINVEPLEHKQVHEMVYDIMNDSQRKAYEETLECDFSFEIQGLARFRVNAFNQNRGAGAVFRTIPSKILTLEQLNAPKVFAELSLKPRGLVLVTGPTGSGKSTTLAGMVNHLNENEYGHVLTVEDPIEFVHESKKCLVNQREVGPHTLSFSNALRSALREDPDAIHYALAGDAAQAALYFTRAAEHAKSRFAHGAALGLYPGFLAALFVLASGITLLQVAANPLIAVLGDTAKSHSRLTLAQAFNSLGTTVGPWVGAVLILEGMTELPDPSTLTPAALAALRKAEAHAVQLPFLGIAAVLVAVAAVFWLMRHWKGAPQSSGYASSEPTLAFLRTNPRLALGVLSIFMYVGAEVSIGSLLVNYLMQSSTLGLAAVEAGKLVSFYWGGAMVGRFIGSYVLRVASPGKVLAGCALAAASLATVSGLSTGAVAAVTVIAIGLMNSIMFPTIFSLAIEGLGASTSRGSGLLCQAIVGGAIVPLATGWTADQVGIGLALLVPAACYVVIASYGWYARRPAGAAVARAGRP